MRFLDPLFLWGLGALAVPLALHLLLRRRVPVLEFPLQRLVMRAEQSRQPRKRLNRVLLLIARAAILSLLALALARLTFGGGDLTATGPVAAVIVVDDSLSLQARAEDGGTILEAGLEAAESLVAALPEGSRVAVLRASAARPGTAGALALPGTLGSPAAARAELGRVEPTFAHAPMGDALRAAMTMLAAAPQADRRIVLVSDLARHSLADLVLPRWESGPNSASARPRLQLLSPRREKGPNFSVSGLDAAALPGGRLRVTARVAAWGLEKASDSQVELRSGAVGEALREVSRTRITVGAGASEERRFDIAAPPEGFAMSVVSLPDDVLPADNVRHCAHHLARRASVLVVDGDPQNLAIASETFYLEKALAPAVGLDVDADIIPVSGLSAASIEGRAVLVLCNVRELSAERVQWIEAAVRGGAGLLVALGNRVDAAAYSGALARMLPATLGLPRNADPPATIQAAKEATDQPLPDLSHVTVRQHVLLEPVEGSKILLRLSSGEPLLIERAFGEGRVLLLGTTIDRDWTDLPISPSYLAFIREAIEHSSPRATSRVLDSVRVGEAIDLSALDLTEAASLLTPDGTRVDLPVGTSLFTQTSQPGLHVVSVSGRTRGVFVVVVDPVESDLSRVSPDEIELALRGSLDAGGAMAGTQSETGGVPAWKALLALLVIACAAESWLARRAA